MFVAYQYCIFLLVNGRVSINNTMIVSKAHNAGILIIFQLQEERDDLHSKFVSAIQEVQQKSSMKNVLLEHKLHILEEIVEQKDAQLNNAINASHRDQGQLNRVAKGATQVTSGHCDFSENGILSSKMVET